MFVKNIDKEYRKEDKYIISLAEMALIISKILVSTRAIQIAFTSSRVI